MENISIVGVIVSGVLIILTLIELILFFSSFRKSKRSFLILHFLGTVATTMVTIATISATINVKIESKVFAEAAAILAILFFVLAGINTLIVEKTDNNKRDNNKVKKN